MLLAQHHDVVALDINEEKIHKLNQGISPIIDADISSFLQRDDIQFKATLDAREAFTGADFVIISTPTNYDPKKNFFDTSSVEMSLRKYWPSIRRRRWSSSQRCRSGIRNM